MRENQGPPSRKDGDKKVVRGMSGKFLRELRKKKKKENATTQEELANIAGVSQRWLQTYEQCEARYESSDADGDKKAPSSPTLDPVLKIVDKLEPSVEELIDLFALDYLKNSIVEIEYQGGDSPIGPVVYSDRIRRLLEKYNDMRYICFYHTKETDPLQILDITERLHYGEGGYLQAPATARGNSYSCTMTCASDTSYAFLYFQSMEEDLGDSVHFALPYAKRARPHFHVGIGTMQNIYYPSGGKERLNPCFELMAIVSYDYIYRIGRRNMQVDANRSAGTSDEDIKQAGVNAIKELITDEAWLRLPDFYDDYLMIVHQDYIKSKSHEFYKRVMQLVE